MRPPREVPSQISLFTWTAAVPCRNPSASGLLKSSVTRNVCWIDLDDVAPGVGMTGNEEHAVRRPVHVVRTEIQLDGFAARRSPRSRIRENV